MTSIAGVRGPQDCQPPDPHPPCHLGSHEAHPPSRPYPQFPAQSHLRLCSYPQARRVLGRPNPAHLVSLPGAPSSLLANRGPPTLSRPQPLSLEESEDPGGHVAPSARPSHQAVCGQGSPSASGRRPQRPLRPPPSAPCVASAPRSPSRTSCIISGKVALGLPMR